MQHSTSSSRPLARAQALNLLRPAAILLILLVFAAPAAAQSITGRVVGDDASQPMRGALVTLLDASGQRVRSVLTNASGMFSIAVPGPGTYRLRAEMIGRRTTESEVTVGAGNPDVVQLALAFEPIRLDGVTVTAASRCSTKAEAAEATIRVWDEIKKALRAESVTRELAIYEFEITRARRELDPNTMRVLYESETKGKSVATSPFTTLSPKEIADDGYARPAGGGAMKIYGPNTEVLLSPEFEETHCFSLKEGSRSREGQVGLVFKPVDGRKVTDIEGVLWIDASSVELQQLEFKYKRIPYGLARGAYTGLVNFQRLEGGAWIIGHWRLTTPVTEEEAEVSSLEPLHTREWVEVENANGNGTTGTGTSGRPRPR